MKLNYVLLPDNYKRQPRPRPGYRRLPKKAYEAFTPMSRAGRRVPGEAKVKTAKVNNAKEDEERNGSRLFKFIRKLNKNLSARPSYRSDKQTKVDTASISTVTNDVDVSGWLSSQVPQKRSMADSDKSFTSEVLNERVIKRPRSNAISSSSRLRPRLLDAVNTTGDAIDSIRTVNSGHVNTSNAQQIFAEEQFHHYGLPPNTNVVQHHPPFALHAVHDIAPPIMLHQPVNQLDIFPPHGIANQPGQQFWLGAGAAHGFTLQNDIEARNYDYELERVAIGCARVALGEPMDVDAEFPTLMANDDYADLERVAVGCAYACIDDPMDTAPDNTQGPILQYVPQEQHAFDPLGFRGQFEFDGMLQRPVFDTVHDQEYEYFVDQDQRLRPPMHLHFLNREVGEADGAGLFEDLFGDDDDESEDEHFYEEDEYSEEEYEYSEEEYEYDDEHLYEEDEYSEEEYEYSEEEYEYDDEHLYEEDEYDDDNEYNTDEDEYSEEEYEYDDDDDEDEDYDEDEYSEEDDDHYEYEYDDDEDEYDYEDADYDEYDEDEDEDDEVEFVI